MHRSFGIVQLECNVIIFSLGFVTVGLHVFS